MKGEEFALAFGLLMTTALAPVVSMVMVLAPSTGHDKSTNIALNSGLDSVLLSQGVFIL